MGQLVAYKRWPFIEGFNCKDLTGKIFAVLDRWLLMRGDQTRRFNCSYVKELCIMIWIKQKHTVEISTYLRQKKTKQNKNGEREVLISLRDHTLFPAHVPAWWVKSNTFHNSRNYQNKFDYLCCWQQKPKHEYYLEFIIKRKPESNYK